MVLREGVAEQGILADLRSFVVQFPNECAGGPYTGCEEGCMVEEICQCRRSDGDGRIEVTIKRAVGLGGE